MTQTTMNGTRSVNFYNIKFIDYLYYDLHITVLYCKAHNTFLFSINMANSSESVFLMYMYISHSEDSKLNIHLREER